MNRLPRTPPHQPSHLRAAGGGSIVNLSSIAGLVCTGGVSPYHAFKGAVRLMSKNDVVTYAPFLHATIILAE